MYNIITQLEGGDRRSIGKSDDVADKVLQNTDLFSDLFYALKHTDEVVRMRAADAMEKITRKKPDLLQPFKEEIIKSISKIEQQEVQWHVAQVLPRLELNKKELN